jgi:hypothetical protein
MDEEEEVRNFVGRLCAGFRLAWLHPPPESEVGDEWEHQIS